MGNRFLNSAGAAPLTPYETSASAATTLTSLLTGATVASDEIIWVKNDSVTVESTATVALTSEGASSESPLRVVSTNDWGDTPSAISPGAKLATSGNSAINIAGNWAFSGIAFHSGAVGTPGSSSGVTVCSGPSSQHMQTYDDCEFIGAANARPLQLGAVGNGANKPMSGVLRNCRIGYPGTSNVSRIENGRYQLVNLALTLDSAIPTIMFHTDSTAHAIVEFSDFDWSAYAIGTIFNPLLGFNGTITLSNGKLHPSTLICGGWLAPGGELLLINCDSGDTHTRHERYGYEGTWKVATTVYATTNPALMDGTVNYSIQMSSSATVGRNLPLYSQWMQVWNDGTAYTPSVEILVQGDGAAALNSDELWLEVDYTSGTDSPLGTRAITCPDIITAGTAVASGTTAWTGDNYTTERTHKLTSASITPTNPGYIYMRVALAKPSASVYVNPPR